jgi:hypothetical protein
MKACRRRQGEGYQSRLNSLLRSAMIEQLRSKAKGAKLGDLYQGTTSTRARHGRPR